MPAMLSAAIGRCKPFATGTKRFIDGSACTPVVGLVRSVMDHQPFGQLPLHHGEPFATVGRQ